MSVCPFVRLSGLATHRSAALAALLIAMGACLTWPWPDARAEDPKADVDVDSVCVGAPGQGPCVTDPECPPPVPDQEESRNSWSPSPSIDLGNPACKPTGPTLICVGLGGYQYSISGYSDKDTYTPQKRTRGGAYNADCVWEWGVWGGWANDGSPGHAGDSTSVTAWHTSLDTPQHKYITNSGVLTAPTSPGTISITATIDDAPASVSDPDVGDRDDSPVTSAALAVTVVAVTDLLVPGATPVPDGDTDNVNTKAYVIAKSDTAGTTLVVEAVLSSGTLVPPCLTFTGGTAIDALHHSIPLDQPGTYTLDVICGTSFKKAVVYVVGVQLQTDVPESIRAKTAWSGLTDDECSTTISISTSPSGREGWILLSVWSVFPPDPHVLNGWLSKNSDAQWKYEAFEEPKTEKHPNLKTVRLVAVLAPNPPPEVVLPNVQTNVYVYTVFDYKANQPAGIPGDRNAAWQFAKWKYDIDTSGLSSIAYDQNLGHAGSTSTVTDACALGPSAFVSENICASVMGHENVHGVQEAWFILWSVNRFNAGLPQEAEKQAYQWEIDHQSDTGTDAGYIDNVQAWWNYYNCTGPYPGAD
ncbi:MAG: hypothetical protein A3K18_28245 [Lentisphaerae bacterium RIFOXYA12_64_32]|nr:MAG: hypothetical protein A3K18_28245 [Lentisphaerae bacterium RIFOXYA12_64_32]